MRIGVPKEIKNHEYRVGMVPAGVRDLVAAGHQVFVQSTAGAGIGVDDAAYAAAGAKIVTTAKESFDTADLIVKVKEPQLAECKMLRPGQMLFTYLHLAADAEQAKALMASGATAIAYETVTSPDGSLPLLTPMSEVAGRMSVQVGAASLQKANGGRVCCSVACLALRPRRSSFSAAACRARVRPKSQSACVLTSLSSIALSSACARSTHCSPVV